MKTSSAEDLRFMRLALRLARRGRNVRPNPQVGCVLARAGRVVGRGFHAVFGGPHAEPLALRRAGVRARGATAYVTLEPCCHEGKKTPPCVPALIRAGVSRVVAGTEDPNPKVSGRGLALLRRAGIRVQAGLLGRECRALIRPFAERAASRRPRVILKAAASLDGRIATRSRDSRWITSAAARRLGHRFRAAADAVLVGVGTVLADNPGLLAHGAGRNPLRVVLDSRLRTPRGARVLDGEAPALIFTSRPAPPPRLGRALVIRVPKGPGGLDLRAILAELSGMGVGAVLVEGGSRVLTSFLEAGLADELRLFLAPLLIGGEKAPAFFEGRGAAALKSALRVSKLRIRRVGPDLLIAGRLR